MPWASSPRSSTRSSTADISVLAFSTFDTDWVLVPAAQTVDAADAWRRAGLVTPPPH
jgi:hypothetical protein